MTTLPGAARRGTVRGGPRASATVWATSQPGRAGPGRRAATWRRLPGSSRARTASRGASGRESDGTAFGGPADAARAGGPRPPSRSLRRYNRAMAHRVTLIPGDGIGPELAEATTRVLDATGIGSSGSPSRRARRPSPTHGTPLPDEVLESIKRNKVALKGPITTPVGGGFRSVNVTLRQALGLYANLRPARSMRGRRVALRGRRPGHRPREHRGPLRRHRAHGRPRCRREHQDHHPRGLGADRAIRLRLRRRERPAQGHRRPQGQHHEAVRRPLPRELPHRRRRTTRAGSSSRTASSTTCACSSSRSPSCTTCCVLPNLYGDIVSDLCAGLVGGLGVAPGANIGTEAAVFEPVHGSAPKYAGLDKANPTAMILSRRPDAPPSRPPGRPRPSLEAAVRERHRRGQGDHLRPRRAGRHARVRRRGHRPPGPGRVRRMTELPASLRAGRPPRKPAGTAPQGFGTTDPHRRLVVLAARGRLLARGPRPVLRASARCSGRRSSARRTRPTATCRRSTSRCSGSRPAASASRRRS